MPTDVNSTPTPILLKSNQHKKLERLCGYVTRPAIAEQRLSLASWRHWRQGHRSEPEKCEQCGGSLPDTKPVVLDRFFVTFEELPAAQRKKQGIDRVLESMQKRKHDGVWIIKHGIKMSGMPV